MRRCAIVTRRRLSRSRAAVSPVSRRAAFARFSSGSTFPLGREHVAERPETRSRPRYWPDRGARPDRAVMGVVRSRVAPALRWCMTVARRRLSRSRATSSRVSRRAAFARFSSGLTFPLGREHVGDVRNPMARYRPDRCARPEPCSHGGCENPSRCLAPALQSANVRKLVAVRAIGPTVVRGRHRAVVGLRDAMTTDCAGRVGAMPCGGIATRGPAGSGIRWRRASR